MEKEKLRLSLKHLPLRRLERILKRCFRIILSPNYTTYEDAIRRLDTVAARHTVWPKIQLSP